MMTAWFYKFECVHHILTIISQVSHLQLSTLPEETLWTWCNNFECKLLSRLSRTGNIRHPESVCCSVSYRQNICIHKCLHVPNVWYDTWTFSVCCHRFAAATTCRGVRFKEWWEQLQWSNFSGGKDKAVQILDTKSQLTQQPVNGLVVFTGSRNSVSWTYKDRMGQWQVKCWQVSNKLWTDDV